jgi:hypothetical protein
MRRIRLSKSGLNNALIDNNSLMGYQQTCYVFRGAEDEGNITLNIKRHRVGTVPVGGVFSLRLKTTMIYTYVLIRGPAGVCSPMD